MDEMGEKWIKMTFSVEFIYRLRSVKRNMDISGWKIMTEINNLWEEFNRRLDIAEDRNNKIKMRSIGKKSKLKLRRKKQQNLT